MCGLTLLVEKMLYGVTPTDPVAVAGACGLLVLLALPAAYVPSRWAARLSPVETGASDVLEIVAKSRQKNRALNLYFGAIAQPSGRGGHLRSCGPTIRRGRRQSLWAFQ